MSHPQRRSDDTRVTQLVTDVAQMKDDIAANTALTKEVKDILNGFRTAGKVVKFIVTWVTAGAAVLVALQHGWHAIVDLRR